MRKRRPGSELSYDRFNNYIGRDDTYVFEHGKTKNFGQKYNNCFVPTHFAPGGLKDGIDAIKALKDYDNVLFAVTPDLSKMLKRLGYKSLPFSVKKDFRGVPTKKIVLSSNWISVFVNTLQDSLNNINSKVKSEIRTNIERFKNRKLYSDDKLYKDDGIEDYSDFQPKGI